MNLRTHSPPAQLPLSNTTNRPVNLPPLPPRLINDFNFPLLKQRHILSQRPQLETDPGGDPLNKQRVRVTLGWPLTLQAIRFNLFFRGCTGSFLLEPQHVFWGGCWQGSFNRTYPPFTATVNLSPSGCEGITMSSLSWEMCWLSKHEQWTERKFGGPEQSQWVYLVWRLTTTYYIKAALMNVYFLLIYLPDYIFNNGSNNYTLCERSHS